MRKQKRESYYARNRARILKKMQERYQTDQAYREATRKRARRRYHEDEAYRRATIERAKARYRKLKQQASAYTAMQRSK